MSEIDWRFGGGGVLVTASLAGYYGPKRASAFSLGDGGREVYGSDVLTGGVRR